MCLNIQFILSHRFHVGQWAHLLEIYLQQTNCKSFCGHFMKSGKRKKMSPDAAFLVWFLLYISFLLVVLLLNVASKCNANMPSGASVLNCHVSSGGGNECQVNRPHVWVVLLLAVGFMLRKYVNSHVFNKIFVKQICGVWQKTIWSEALRKLSLCVLEEQFSSVY